MEVFSIKKENVWNKVFAKSKFSGIFLFVSTIILLYMIFVLLPYADQNGFYNVNGLPKEKSIGVFNWLSFPIVISYFLFLAIYFRKITFGKSIVYPLLIANIFIGAYCLSVSFVGFALLLLSFYLVIIPVSVVTIGLIVGIVKDVKYVKLIKHS